MINNSDKKFLIIAVILSILIVFIPIVLQIYWHKKTSDELWFCGFLQSDQIVYTALFRSVIEKGNGISYSYPYSQPGDENPPVFFQIPFTILAYLWKISANNLIIPWEIIRIIFGIGFFIVLFVSVFELFKLFYPDKKDKDNFNAHILLIFLILAFGGGIAWLISIIKFIIISLSNQGAAPNFLEIFGQVELSYHWWFLNLFRNIFYPLELQYHFLFFLAVLGVVRKNFPMVFAGQFLSCWSGVFVGIEISAILIPYFILEYIINRDKKHLYQFILLSLSFLLFVGYYNYLLPKYPVAGSLVEQHKSTIYDTIPLHSYFAAYGILLFTTPFVFINKKFRILIFRNPSGRFLLVWLLTVGGLIFNDKFLPTEKIFQPPHFTRGYFFTISVLISSLGLYPYWETFITKYNKYSKIFSILIFLFFIPDNILFLAERFSEPPHFLFLTIPKESKETFDFLNTIKTPKVIFSADRNLGGQIPAFTHHYSIFGLLYSTPFNEEKGIMAEKFFRNVDVDIFIKKYSINIIIIPKVLSANFEKIIKQPNWEVIFQNPIWKIYEIPNP